MASRSPTIIARIRAALGVVAMVIDPERLYVELYLAAYARRRGHAFDVAPERRAAAAAGPTPIRAPAVRPLSRAAGALDQPFERVPLAVRHTRVPVRLRA